MDVLLEILKLTIPGGIVFLTVYFMLKQHFDSVEKIKLIESRQSNKRESNPVRMQAYERMILFLERIHPDNLAMRTQKNGMSARVHQSEMLRTVRNEFDHNVSQQLYVSAAAWKLVKQAKEEVVRLINISASQVGEDATAVDLSKALITITSNLDKVPTDVARAGLKQEFRSIF